jgi:hypothetical protein
VRAPVRRLAERRRGGRWPARRAADVGGRCRAGSDRGLNGEADPWARFTVPAV